MAIRRRSGALPVEFFTRPAEVVARELLGCLLVRELAGERLVVRVVETEAYLGAGDPASHAWGGRRTARNASLYLPPGHAYVYFIYGMHFCLNAVANAGEGGGAVLFRAAEVVEGSAEVARRRGIEGRTPRPGELLGGPGRLCQGLGIDRALDGASFAGGALRLLAGGNEVESDISVGPRVGVAYAGEAALWPLRFALRAHPEVSRPKLESRERKRGASASTAGGRARP